MNPTNRQRINRSLGLGILLAIVLPASALAKLNAAPGEDGAPPDPQTQAEVDAINEALEPPEEDESWDGWLSELEAAQDALYGPEVVTSTPPGPSCEVVEDSAATGCDGDPTWVTLGDPYDIVLSEPVQCPYPSYLACLLAGETIDYCKSHVLNCHEGELTTASVTVDFNARQCDEGLFCLCAQANGDIRFFGTSFVSGEETCLDISGYDYNGPFDNQVAESIEEELNAINWQVCLPTPCLE